MSRFFIILIIIFLINSALAQNGIDRAQAEIMRILGNIIKFAFSVLMILASGLLILLGIFLIVTGRDKFSVLGQEVEARKSFLYITLGIVLLITAFFIPNLIKNFIESSIK